MSGTRAGRENKISFKTYHPRPSERGRKRMENSECMQREKGEKEMTFREKVHIIISLAGCISKAAIGMLDGTEYYKHRAIYRMKDRGLVEKRKKAWCMTKAGLEDSKLWRNKIPEKYTKNAGQMRKAFLKSSEGEVRRRLYQSEVLAAMLESGVELWISSDETPEPGSVVYIGSKKMKEDYIGENKSINMTRAVGTLIVGSQKLINVYAMGNGTITWVHSRESKYKVWSENKYLKMEGNPREAEALLLIDSTGNLKRFIGTSMDKGGPIRAGDIYKRMYVLPKNQMGTSLLAVLILPGSKQVAEEISREYNASNFILPDLVELKRYQMTGTERVCCIEGYGEGVKEVVPGADVIEIPMEEVIGRIVNQ